VGNDMKEVKKDCFSCSQSMVTDGDKLFCVIHQKEVEDDGYCDDYN
jgi:hypothetical protein